MNWKPLTSIDELPINKKILLHAKDNDYFILVYKTINGVIRSSDTGEFVSKLHINLSHWCEIVGPDADLYQTKPDINGHQKTSIYETITDFKQLQVLKGMFDIQEITVRFK